MHSLKAVGPALAIVLVKDITRCLIVLSDAISDALNTPKLLRPAAIVIRNPLGVHGNDA